MRLNQKTINIFILGASLFFIACGGSSGNEKNVNLKFGAKISNSNFSCEANYGNVGTTGSSIVPKDLRFYVYDINLLDDQGNKYPVDLDQDGLYQEQDLALVDLEDGKGSCQEEGNATIHDTVTGKVDSGTYTGISFILGVPFELNHSDTTVAPSPLNSTAMAWNWNAGRKFFKLDFNSTGMPAGYSVHLGSTGCSGNAAGAVNACTSPNRVTVELKNYNPDTNTIIVNLDSLLAGANVDSNTPETAPGCMSGQVDPECRSIFQKLGLPIQEIPAASQSIFQVE